MTTSGMHHRSWDNREKIRRAGVDNAMVSTNNSLIGFNVGDLQCH